MGEQSGGGFRDALGRAMEGRLGDVMLCLALALVVALGIACVHASRPKVQPAPEQDAGCPARSVDTLCIGG